MSYFRSITQNVVSSTGNSSTTSLSKSPDAGYIFVGTAESTLGVAGIQVALSTNQNCIVYIEQSPEGTNWDISDEFNYRYLTGSNFGVTTQAVSSFFRVRVENESTTAAATNFRLQSCLCPIVEAIPRALSAEGNLKVGVYEIEDTLGNLVKISPQGGLRTTPACKLIGASFNGTTIDANFWAFTGSAGGTGVQTGGQYELRTNTTANALTALQSVRTSRYINGCSNVCRILADYGGAGVLKNTKRWGVFTGTANAPTDGAMFELINTVPSIATYKAGTPTRVTNGNFNGEYGTTINAIPSGCQTFEIVYTNKVVWFMFNNLLVHKIDATADTWADTMSLPLRAENNNTDSGVVDTSLKIRSFSVYRYGDALARPQWKNQVGAVTASILKRGPGTLHRVCINTSPNGAIVTLYDALTATNPICVINPATDYSAVMVYELDFYTGLTYTTVNAGVDVTFVFE
jgi:hypothetical protein